MIETERVLFDGRLGTQRLRVWLESRAGSIVLASHDIGPALERVFGKDEIETYLEVDAVHLPNLTAALRAERTDPDATIDAIELLAARYRGDATPTTALRAWLTAHGIPHRFTIVRPPTDPRLASGLTSLARRLAWPGGPGALTSRGP